MKTYCLIFFILLGVGALQNAVGQTSNGKSCFSENELKKCGPDTLVYDNIISNFHATLIWGKGDTLYGWGENIAPVDAGNLSVPTPITPDNGFRYKGNPLKMAAGSRGIHSGQYALLTTQGLYIWGKAGNLVSRTIKREDDFGAVTIMGQKDGLPKNVHPDEIKMLFGSYLTLVVVTDSGQAWVLSGVGRKGGNGLDKNQPEQWARVDIDPGKPLRRVVAVRGTPFALMALTSEGKMYTWGINTYLGDGTTPENHLFATPMTVPKGVHPKMIGMTTDDLLPSYYLLTMQGKLFSLGYNSKKQLGLWNTFPQRYWQRALRPDASVRKPSTPFVQVAWISPDEHDGSGFPAVNILTKSGRLYAWGWNHRDMIGGAVKNKAYNPIFMPGQLDSAVVIDAVETGGHTTIIFRRHKNGYGYVGHKIYGSMGDGEPSEETSNRYQFIGEK